jgi:hypothetical protein
VLGLLVVGFVCIRFGFIYSLRVETQGSNHNEVAAALSAEIDSFVPWWRRLKPFSDPSRLEQDVLGAYPQLAKATITVNFWSDELVVAATTRSPVAVAEFTDSQTYFVDDIGVAFEVERLPTAARPTLNIKDTSGFAPKAGEVAISPGVLQFIVAFDQELSRKGLFAGGDVITFQVPAKLRQVELVIATQAYKVLLNTDRGVVDQARELGETLDYIKRQRLSPQSYIDLRVDDTAYIR